MAALHILLLVVFSSLQLSSAQSLTLIGPTNVRVGQSITLTLAFTSGAGSVSGFQFETPAQPWTTALVNKTMTCNAATARCVLIGQNNAAALVTGTVASAVWIVPAIVPASIALSNIVATAPDASLATLTAPAPLSLSVIGDVTGDRQVTLADVIASIAQVVGLQPCTTADQNGDGVCNVRDIQLVATEVMNSGG